ncbi:hypothetical protein J2W68_001967 [Luteimonas terrae]|uniref:Uncharacterized protein n=1 Tax=Luteimonas terrae TaxID=1530191 RepID=A0ABU1XWV0_9GAMM|nr:hypothetical protein [Luteimonas terrae]
MRPASGNRHRTLNKDAGVNADDVELCRVYGQLSREYLGARSWADCEAQLRDGWLRLRRDPAMNWEDAAPLVRTFWELTSVDPDLS